MCIVAVGGNVLLLQCMFKQHTGRAKHSRNRNNHNTSDNLNNSCRNHNKRNNGKAFNNKTQTTTKATTEATTKKKKVTATKIKKKKKTNTVTCTVTVECKSILDHIDDLKEGHEEFVPDDGYIIKDYTYKAKKGYTAYDALKGACKKNDIKLTAKSTSYGIYISGINNLDEFDCGKQSGWMYSVNGIMPNTTCGNVSVDDGDSIVFTYVCTFQ